MNQSTLCEVMPFLSPPQRHEAIARRAYEKWVKRGCPHGTDIENWLQAEAEITTELDGEEPKDAVHWPHLGNGWHPSA
jgi:hypothetical protein